MQVRTLAHETILRMKRFQDSFSQCSTTDTIYEVCLRKQHNPILIFNGFPATACHISKLRRPCLRSLLESMPRISVQICFCQKRCHLAPLLMTSRCYPDCSRIPALPHPSHPHTIEWLEVHRIPQMFMILSCNNSRPLQRSAPTALRSSAFAIWWCGRGWAARCLWKIAGERSVCSAAGRHL